jgi:hypothetical protein
MHMSFGRYLILAALLAGGPTFSAGQSQQGQTTDEPRSTPAPALSGIVGVDAPVTVEDSSGSLPQIPSILGGRGPSLVFRGEQERSNYLRAGINAGATYDDNASLVSTGAVSNTTFSIFPSIALEQTFPRMRWNLGYGAGFTVNQRLSNRNQGSHDLSFDSQFRLSPHVSLRFAEDFALTSGFFDAGNSNLAGNGGPNATVLTPLSKQRSSSTVAEADYHFALRDIAGVSGSFYNLHYSDVTVGTLFTDTQNATASAFWLHAFGRNWLGGSYRFQHLTFNPGSGVTDVHSFLIIDTITLPARFTLSGFAGTDHSDNRGLAPGAGVTSNFSNWSPSFGVDASWQRDRTSAAVGFSRRVSDGSGLLGAVRLQDIHGALRQELFPGWALNLSTSYGNNKSLTVPATGSASSVDFVSLQASVARNLGKKLDLHVGYAHEFQDQSGTIDPAFLGGAHRNRVFVTLGYQWAKPLGR